MLAILSETFTAKKLSFQWSIMIWHGIKCSKQLFTNKFLRLFFRKEISSVIARFMMRNWNRGSPLPTGSEVPAGQSLSTVQLEPWIVLSYRKSSVWLFVAWTYIIIDACQKLKVNLLSTCILKVIKYYQYKECYKIYTVLIHTSWVLN